MKRSARPVPPALPSPVAQAACNRLLCRSIELRENCRRAARVRAPGACVVLEEEIRTLGLLIGDLQAHGGGNRRMHDHNGWRGSVRRQLAGWLPHAAARPDRARLLALPVQQATLLEAFDGAIARLRATSAGTLCRPLPRLHRSRRDMHCLVGHSS